MFDVGFTEILLLSLVGLLVLGPERLPRVARTAGLWLGRARRFVSTVKADIDREIAADELKQTLAKQAEVPELYDIVEDTKQTIQKTKQPVAEQHPPADNEAPAKNPNDAGG